MNFNPSVALGQAEGERIRRVLFGILQQRGRKHHDRVGDRQGRQHPGALDHEAGVGLLLHPRRQERVRLLRGADRAVDLRVDQRVRQRQVAFAHVPVERPGVRPAPRVRRIQPAGGSSVGAHRAVQVAGVASRHPEAEIREPVHRIADANEILPSLGNHEAHSHRIARFGRGKEQGFGFFVLKVVAGCKTAHTAGYAVFGGDVFNLSSPMPQLHRRILESLNELGACSC